MKNRRRIVFCFKKKNIFSFEKNGPGEFLYGFDYVSKYIPSSCLFADEYRYRHLFFLILEKFFAKKTRLGIYFQAFLNNSKKIKKTDLLFAINDGVGLGLLFFKMVGKLDNKMIVIIQGLHDRYKYFKNNGLLVSFYKNLLGGAEIVLTLSKYEKKLLIKSFQIEPKRVRVFNFGTDIDYWNKNVVKNITEKEEFVLTVGSDMHRDYDLLLNYYNLDIPLKFVTRILRKEQLSKIKESVFFETYQEISNNDLRGLYHRAKFVIIPLKDTFATSGLSVTLQVLAMGRPVLLAKTPAMLELFEDHKHVLYYEEGSSASFKRKLKELNNDKKLREVLSKNGRKIVEERFNSENMGKQVLRLIKSSVNF